MTSMRALWAWITSERRIGATSWVISAERGRSVGIWTALTSVTRPPATEIRTWTSPYLVGTMAPVNVPLAARVVGVGLGVGVGVSVDVGAGVGAAAAPGVGGAAASAR